jgi:hypothetical protein
VAEGSRFALLKDDDILKIIDDKDVKATKMVFNTVGNPHHVVSSENAHAK